jgi:acetyl-CoA carboxylase biotin carboxylase subunit
MFKKILVANRGEISVRVIKACRDLGIPTVAVYSEADRSALHVQQADEAVCIGPPPPLESYLNIDNLISRAKERGCDAIHPGYGFLAENPEFAKRCEKEGIVFIGPKGETIQLLGNKIESRKLMKKAAVPIIPGMEATSEDMRGFKKAAEKIGYPVLIKASLGGGGKAMKVIGEEKDLESAIESSKREALSAFADDTLYLEKFLDRPRHIEFQILADNYGDTIHLFERECSIQRRHQKIIEETPSTALSPELRKKMGEDALRVAKAAGYSNAGTVEFLLDPQGNYYFLEVNTRVQVEHPVTELTTGVDLVKAQIRIASGEKLWIKPEDLRQQGHAIECRIYAEDPENSFLPSAGKILFLREPFGPGIRNDSGIYSGFTVPVYYDPILSKLLVWAGERNEAIRRMEIALSEYIILGIKTNVAFLRDVIVHPEFASGKTYTDFLGHHFSEYRGKSDRRKFMTPALVAASLIPTGKAASEAVYRREESLTPWQTLGSWRVG